MPELEDEEVNLLKREIQTELETPITSRKMVTEPLRGWGRYYGVVSVDVFSNGKERFLCGWEETTVSEVDPNGRYYLKRGTVFSKSDSPVLTLLANFTSVVTELNDPEKQWNVDLESCVLN